MKKLLFFMLFAFAAVVGSSVPADAGETYYCNYSPWLGDGDGCFSSTETCTRINHGTGTYTVTQMVYYMCP